MRVAQIVSKYYPFIGGVEKFVQNISEMMVAKGHTVEVLTSDLQRNLERSSELNGVIIKRFRKSLPFHYSTELSNYLLNNIHRYDIIHAHNFHSLIPALSSIVQWKSRSKSSLILMGHYHGKGKLFLSNILLRGGRYWFKKAYKFADIVFCHTEYEKNMLNDHFKIPEEKIKIIPSGVAIDEIRTAKSYDVNSKILLIVSRLEKYKNIHIAIRSMPYLPKNFKLIIIGDGPIRKELEESVLSLDLIDRVKFLGRLTNEEVYRWYKSCSLVLNLSDLEAFGLTVIEGLAAEKPVIVNNRTALAELARRFEAVSAIDINAIGYDELAKIITLKTDIKNVEMNLNNYRWESISEQLLSYYQSIKNPEFIIGE